MNKLKLETFEKRLQKRGFEPTKVSIKIIVTQELLDGIKKLNE